MRCHAFQALSLALLLLACSGMNARAARPLDPCDSRAQKQIRELQSRKAQLQNTPDLPRVRMRDEVLADGERVHLESSVARRDGRIFVENLRIATTPTGARHRLERGTFGDERLTTTEIETVDRLDGASADGLRRSVRRDQAYERGVFAWSVSEWLREVVVASGRCREALSPEREP